MMATITGSQETGYKIKTIVSEVSGIWDFDEALTLAEKMGLGVFDIDCEIPERITPETYATINRGRNIL
mgnify:FL=1